MLGARMNQLQKYPLAMTGAFLLPLIAQSILLAPHTQADLFASLPAALLVFVGVAFHFIGVFLFASVLLSYPKPILALGNLSSGIAFVLLSWGFALGGYRVEGGIALALALGLFLSNWLNLRSDWLVECMQWANMLIGACLLLRPVLLMNSQVYDQFSSTARLTFGVILLLTSITGFVISLVPSFANVKIGRILALPWIFWGLMFVMPTRLANLFLLVSIVVGLILGEYIPWEKLVLVQAAGLGRRFLRLLVIAQVLFLGLSLWIIYLAETGLPSQSGKLLDIRLAAMVGYNVLSLLGILVMASVNLSINGLFSGLNSKSPVEPQVSRHNQGLIQRFAAFLMAPFDRSQNLLREYVLARQAYESLHNKQIAAEKRRMAQLNLLHQLNLELKSVLDPPVSAQLTANAIFNSLGGGLVSILQFDQKQDELVAIATSGPQSSSVPPGYRQKTCRGLLGRAARLRRTQLASDTRLDSDYFQLEKQQALSEVVVPLLQHNRLQGAILVDAQEPNVFDDSDIRTLETVAVQLVTSWERSEHDERLTNLIGAGITLSTTLDVEGEIKEIAQIAKATLDARFVFVALTDKGGGFTRTANEGYAPTLLSILNSDPGRNTLIQDVINSNSALRLRDVRKRYTSTLTGGNELRSLLAVPIRVRQSSIGAILVFGKAGNISFSERDESLVSLLASQAAAAIESTWLYQELRSMLSTATQLYALSIRVIQSEQLTDAAAAMVETAYKLSKGESAGIVLTALGKAGETRVQIDSDGLHPGEQHPMELIDQALESEQTIIVSGANQTSRVIIPLQTPRGQYGALWVQVPEQFWSNSRYTDNLHTLANQAAIALERSLLIMETRKQAEELETAYHELEVTYDQTLGALSSALDARDRETEGHSLRVARIAHRLGLRVGLTQEQAKTLERGSILHDIGKIGISDSILLKPGPLSEKEWLTMREHPDIGARIIEGIPFLQETLPVIRFHQERWNGSGYPIGLKGHEIPVMARIFSIVDAFDALTNDRPYRKRSAVSESLAFLRENAGVLFDPVLVAEFEAMIKDGELASLA
jgi:HD-GYP domain-containing protein (c-di-GMP phosphodiesterase class II)/GAF domain-containing protein